MIFWCFSRTSVKSASGGNCHRKNASTPESARHQSVHDRADFAFDPAASTNSSEEIDDASHIAVDLPRDKNAGREGRIFEGGAAAGRIRSGRGSVNSRDGERCP
ncbi:MAG: hypothetical protein DMF95_17785 [Acidobacteria bacterium]|nr:MAG: hypothetical protein DMF96_02525 [Acidobacteriota bacterium]PYR19632.1 MAG: hypothetical protein DMF94_15145 [Acidobacteriota bacterium]PYR46793.1 MAG: hypothetical protein DMF95_17785 [Acidobacteriota bacterium]